MSDPTMPAGLAELLSEPGWERGRYGLVWRLSVAAAASDCFEEDGAPCIRGDDWVKIDALKGV